MRSWEEKEEEEKKMVEEKTEQRRYLFPVLRNSDRWFWPERRQVS